MVRNEGHLRGEASEMKVALNLIDNGCRVAYTHGHSHPYDLIADKDNRLFKIQVKTATHEEDQRWAMILKDEDKYNKDNVDLFAAYVPEKDVVFYVPYSDMGRRAAVNFRPRSEMGPKENWDRANTPDEYTFEEAASQWENNRKE